MHEDMARFDESQLQKTLDFSYTGVNSLRTFKTLLEAARLHQIHKNPEYLAKVKELEAAATAILLTAEEQSIVDSVKSSPLLHNIIEQEGTELYSEEY